MPAADAPLTPCSAAPLLWPPALGSVPLVVPALVSCRRATGSLLRLRFSPDCVLALPPWSSGSERSAVAPTAVCRGSVLADVSSPLSAEHVLEGMLRDSCSDTHAGGRRRYAEGSGGGAAV